MPTALLLDSNVLGRVIYPDPAENRFVVNVVGALLGDPEYKLVVPEIIDYELRRSLLLNAGTPLGGGTLVIANDRHGKRTPI